MKHFNDNLPVALGIKTRGIASDCELLEIAIIPLNYRLMKDEKYPPFIARLRPTDTDPMEDDFKIQYEKKPHTAERSSQRLANAMETGIDPIFVLNAFIDWFDHLKMAKHKRLLPIVYDWDTTSNALVGWMGWENMKNYFSSYVRDIMVIAAWENDLAGYREKAYPFGRLEFSGLCSRLGLERISVDGRISAVANAVATYECFMKMLSLGLYDPTFLNKLREEMSE